MRGSTMVQPDFASPAPFFPGLPQIAQGENRGMVAHSPADEMYFRAGYFFLPFAAFFDSTTACAAAKREIGTRNGEALT